MTKSTTLQEFDRRIAGIRPPAAVSLSDAVAMRLGLALLLWGRRHAAAESARFVPAAPLAGDARWYMR